MTLIRPAFSSGSTPSKLLDAIVDFGLDTAAFDLCIDAGDDNSYNGTSQTWSDVSGNGNDWYRGSNGTTEASLDPVFVGTAGDLGAYFRGVGAGGGAGTAYFSSVVAKPTYLENLKLNSIVAAMFAIYRLDTGASAGFFLPSSNNNTTFQNAFLSQAPDLATGNGIFTAENTGAYTGWTGTTISATADTWHAYYFSGDESSNTMAAYLDAAKDATTAFTYTSPPVGASFNPFRIGTSGELNTTKMAVDKKLAALALWQGATTPSEAQLQELYVRMIPRIEVMP